MTYPPTPPTHQGYPAQQPPAGYPAPAATQYPAPSGPSKLPVYLTAAVAALGFGAYLAGFGPLFSIKSDIGPFGGAQFTASGLTYWTVASLVATLLAAATLLPKSKSYTPIVAVTAVLGLLLVIGQMIHRPTGFSVGWGLWLVLLLTVFQAVAAVAALLYESGVLAPPAPRPVYSPYGPPPGGYYGQHGQPGVPQQPGYPAQYGYGSGQVQSQAGGYSTADTPPTGFPAYTHSATPTPASSPENTEIIILGETSGSSQAPSTSGATTPGTNAPGTTTPGSSTSGSTQL